MLRIIFLGFFMLLLQKGVSQRLDTVFFKQKYKSHLLLLPDNAKQGQPILLEGDTIIPTSNYLVREWLNDSTVLFSGDQQWLLFFKKIKNKNNKWYLVDNNTDILFFDSQTFILKNKIHIQPEFDRSSLFSITPHLSYYSPIENEFVYIYSCRRLNSSHDGHHFIFFTPTKGVIRIENDEVSTYLIKPKNIRPD